MKFAEVLCAALWVVSCGWAVGEDDSPARTDCLKKVARNGTTGGVIEKIINLDSSKP